MALAGITNRKRKQFSARTNAPRSAAAVMKKAVFTKACTTDLVGEVMESYFRHQLAALSEKDPKEDGGGENEKNETNGSDDEAGDVGSDSSEKENRRQKQTASKVRRGAMPSCIGINWVGSPEGMDKHKTYYAGVQIGEDLFRTGDAAVFFYQGTNSIETLSP